MKAVIVEDLGHIVYGECDGRRYRIDLNANYPGWGVWRADYSPDLDESRRWMETMKALDEALERHYGKRPA